VYAGLRLYQWLALITVEMGAFFATLTNVPVTATLVFRASSILVAGLCGGWGLSLLGRFPGIQSSVCSIGVMDNFV
jgi:hypothetical protein